MEPHKHSDDCKQVFALLSEYLDAELNPESCDEIRAHLAGCPPCIEFLDSLQRTIRLCHNCESTETPAPLSPDAREQLLAVYRKALAGRAEPRA
jgi:anti-sigma factor (TIGR02949 family)